MDDGEREDDDDGEKFSVHCLRFGDGVAVVRNHTRLRGGDNMGVAGTVALETT